MTWPGIEPTTSRLRGGHLNRSATAIGKKIFYDWQFCIVDLIFVSYTGTVLPTPMNVEKFYKQTQLHPKKEAFLEGPCES